MEYAVLFLAIGAVAFSAFSALSAPRLEMDASGRLLETAQNEKYFQQQAASAGSECGDLQDAANVQHLSHHPSQYSECLKKVDAAFLMQATGQSLQQLIG